MPSLGLTCGWSYLGNKWEKMAGGETKLGALAAEREVRATRSRVPRSAGICEAPPGDSAHMGFLVVEKRLSSDLPLL